MKPMSKIPQMQPLMVPVIGVHQSALKQKFGTPRQPNLVPIISHITMYAPYDTLDAFLGIQAYSHLWIVWQFHHNKTQTHFRPQVRPPRLGGNDKLGVFATRSMYRPSQLGLSVVELVGIDANDNGRGVRLSIRGADMIDGTPIVDIKPYLVYSDAKITAKSGQIDTPSIKEVMLTEAASQKLSDGIQMGILTDEDRVILLELVACDPRPAYRQTEVDTSFVMRYADMDVVFFMNDDGALVIGDIVFVR